MMRIVLLALLALTLSLGMGGCGKKADAQVTCEGCQAKVDKADALEMSGKYMCRACADQHKDEMSANAAEGAEAVTCTGGCGMEVSVADAMVVDGKHYCAGCAGHTGEAEAEQD